MRVVDTKLVDFRKVIMLAIKRKTAEHFAPALAEVGHVIRAKHVGNDSGPADVNDKGALANIALAIKTFPPELGDFANVGLKAITPEKDAICSEFSEFASNMKLVVAAFAKILPNVMARHSE